MIKTSIYEDKVRELAQVNADLAALKARKSELEGWFLIAGDADLMNSKSKSICYQTEDNSSSVTYTQAQKLTLESPTYLKKLFGDVFPDIIEEHNEPTYKVKSAAIERMLIGLYTGSYTKATPTDVISQLPCTAEEKAALTKKLKGANFETDVKNLMDIGGLTEDDASDYAYLYAEAVVYDTFLRVLHMSGADDAAIDEYIKGITVAVSVDDTTKISVK